MLTITGTYLDVYFGHISKDTYNELMASGIDSENLYDYLDDLTLIGSGIDPNNFNINVDRQLLVEHQGNLHSIDLTTDKQYALVIIEDSKIRFFNDNLTQRNIDDMLIEIERVVLHQDRSIILASLKLAGEHLDLSDDIETRSFSAMLMSLDSGVEDCAIN